MHERKRGSSTPAAASKVTSQEQAIAIRLSEARKGGKKVSKKLASRKIYRAPSEAALIIGERLSIVSKENPRPN